MFLKLFNFCKIILVDIIQYFDYIVKQQIVRNEENCNIIFFSDYDINPGDQNTYKLILGRTFHHKFKIFFFPKKNLIIAKKKLNNFLLKNPLILILNIDPNLDFLDNATDTNNFFQLINKLKFDHSLIISNFSYKKFRKKKNSKNYEEWMQIAKEYEMEFIDMHPKFVRWNPDKFWDFSNNQLNKKGISAVSSSISRSLNEFMLRGKLSSKKNLFNNFNLPPIPPRLRFNVLGSNLEVQQRADLLLNGKLLFSKLKNFEKQNFKEPFDWSITGPNRTWLSLFHSLEMLQELIASYFMASNEKYLNHAIKIIYSWSNDNPIKPNKYGRSWHEGTTTKRLINLSYFYNVYRRNVHANKNVCLKLLNIISQHVEFLIDKLNYRPKGNHGLRQDFAILSFSLQIPGNNLSNKWTLVALERIKEHQLEAVNSIDGVYSEHSTSYHCLVFKLYVDILMLYLDTKNNPPNFLFEIINKMIPFITYSILPNENIPPIGDSETKNARDILCIINDLQKMKNLKLSKKLIDYLRYSSSSGNFGLCPDNVDGIYENSGWFIFRNEWKNKKNFSKTVYLNFHANLKSLKHKHADDLSFILYGYNREWIIDPGKYNYELNDDFRNYFTMESSAHNCFSQNGKSYDLYEAKEKKLIKILNFESQKNYSYVSAINKAYKFGSIERNLLFLKEYSLILLFDYFKFSKEDNFETYFHLAHDLEPNLNNAVMSCYKDHYYFDIKQSSKNLKNVSIHKGQTDPILGWYSPTFGEKVPSPVLRYKNLGKEFSTITYLHIYKKKERIQHFEFNNCNDHNSLEVVINDQKIKIFNEKGGNYKCIFPKYSIN